MEKTKKIFLISLIIILAAILISYTIFDIDIIKLNGSIEIAPILGLSDVIVDIVETGATLLENGLEPKETIVNISARLISNKASYKFKSELVDSLKDALSTIVREKQ